jgi:hypothetical protein
MTTNDHTKDPPTRSELPGEENAEKHDPTHERCSTFWCSVAYERSQDREADESSSWRGAF